jgi:hypothetical protein
MCLPRYCSNIPRYCIRWFICMLRLVYLSFSVTWLEDEIKRVKIVFLFPMQNLAVTHFSSIWYTCTFCNAFWTPSERAFVFCSHSLKLWYHGVCNVSLSSFVFSVCGVYQWFQLWSWIILISGKLDSKISNLFFMSS